MALTDEQKFLIVFNNTKLNPNQADDKEFLQMVMKAVSAIEAEATAPLLVRIAELERALDDLGVTPAEAHAGAKRSMEKDARIAALTAQVEQAAQPVAELNISDDDFDLGLTDDYAFGKLRLPNGNHMLYTAPPKAVPLTEPLTSEEIETLERVVEQFSDDGETDVDNAELMRFAARGYLECTHYEVTPAAHRAIEAHHGITPATVEKERE